MLVELIQEGLPEICIRGNENESKSICKSKFSVRCCKKREDGYHDLEMIMAPITLHDLIYINVIDEGIEIESNSKIVPTDQRNIMYKVAQLMQERYGLKKVLRSLSISIFQRKQD